MSNLLVLPGLGSLVAGRRTGYLQATFALVGLVLTCWWAALFGYAWIREQQFPSDPAAHLGIGVLGVALFMVGWIWSLVSSLRILREARSR